jgi:hypothetical protein
LLYLTLIAGFRNKNLNAGNRKASEDGGIPYNMIVPRLGHSEVASPVNTGTCYGVLSASKTGLHILDAGVAILLTRSLSFLSQARLTSGIIEPV